MKLYSCIIVFLLAGSLLSGCKTPQKGSHSPAVKGDTLVKGPVKSQSDPGMLIEAKKQAIIGNTDEAGDMFRRYIERYPKDAAAYFELAKIQADKKFYQDAILLTKKATELDPGNDWYALYLGELYQVTHDLDNAIAIYKTITARNPEDLDYLYNLASLYLDSGKAEEALKIYDRIEEKTGISEDLSLQKYRLYLILKDNDKAEAELKSLIDANPGESRYLGMLAEFYMNNKMQEKALEVYKKIAGVDPENPYIHMSMADYYRKTGNRQKAMEELKLGFANPNLDVDSKVSILLSFYTINEMTSALKDTAFILVKILVDTHPKDPKSHSIYGDLLLQDKQYDAARTQFEEVIKLDSSRYAVWEALLRVDLQLSDFKSTVEHGTKTIELFPDQPLPFMFLGIAYYQLKEYEKSVKMLTSGSKLIVDNDDMLAEFYMYLGDAYHALKNVEESDKAYEKSLAIKDSNAYVLNNYAYYLSVRNKELDRAEKMSKKSLTLEPDNSSFQDTYGWIMFKLGKYKDAREWVSKALNDTAGVSGEVLEHYGDILFRLDDPSGAMEYWQKAKAKGDASEFLDKKILEKRLIEQPDVK